MLIPRWKAIAAPVALSAVVGAANLAYAGRDKQNAAHVDFFGDPLPADAISRLGSVRLRHGHVVMDVVFSPDGKTLASAGHDHTVHIWDAATGKEVRSFVVEGAADPYSQTRWLHCLAFSPDGKHLVCGEHAENWSIKTIRIWDVATGALLLKNTGHRRGIVAVAFSPDGAVLASASADETVKLWDGATNQELRTLTGHQGTVRSVAFSPDGKTIVTGGDDRTVRLWDTATGRELRRLAGHEAEVLSVCFSADGQYLVSGSRDQTVRLWDPATGKGKAILKGHEGAVTRVGWSPTGKIFASASVDKTIRLWQLTSDEPIRTLTGHHMEVDAICFAPDGKTLASGSSDHSVRLWDVATGKQLQRHPGHQENPIALTFLNKSATLVSLAQDKTMRSWDWRTGQEKRCSLLPEASVAPPGELLPKFGVGPHRDVLAIGLEQGNVQLINLTTGAEVGQFTATSGPVLATTFSPDGKNLVSTDGKRALLWDVATRKLLRACPTTPEANTFCSRPTGICSSAPTRPADFGT